MKILYCNRQPLSAEDEQRLGVQRASFDEVLAQSDFISLHVPLTPETHHLMNAQSLAKMKRSAILVNAARGPVVDPDALYDALKNGVIAGAALDVTEPEPIAGDHKLLSLPNCLVVPHIASASVATRRRMSTMAAENAVAALEGRRPANLVNPDMWK